MPYAKPNDSQEMLFGDKEPWKEEWVGMPEFEQKNLLPLYSVRVNFNCLEDLQNFAKLINQTLTIKTNSVWYPKQEKDIFKDKKYVDET